MSPPVHDKPNLDKSFHETMENRVREGKGLGGTLMDMQVEKNCHHTQSTTMMDWLLPIDITSNILSRLTVKYVLRCKCVCKTWRSVVDSPRFSIMHSTRGLLQITTETLSPHNPLLCSSFILLAHPFVGDLNYILEDDSSMFNVSNFNLPYSPNRPPLFLVGSCNGLVCFSSSASQWNPREAKIFVYIYNPITRKCVRSPEIIDSGFRHCTNWSLLFSGFGFDPSTQEFKAVLILSVVGPRVSQTDSRCFRIFEIQVYTLGSNSWRKVICPPDPIVNAHMSVCVNGSVHWLQINSYPCLVSFDLKHERLERFHFLSGPPTPHWPYGFRLGVLEGCLCISDCSSPRDLCQIWVMKNYKERGSWTKQFVIRKCTIDNLLVGAIYPVCFRMNGELVLLCDFKFLVSYNLGTGKATPLECDRLPKGGEHYWAISHVGNLISPKSASFIDEKTLQDKEYI